MCVCVCVCVCPPCDKWKPYARSGIPPSLAIPPLPWEGGLSLGPKSIGNTGRQRRRTKFFFRFHWNWGWGGPSFGDRPPLPWGTGLTLEGGLQGGRGVPVTAFVGADVSGLEGGTGT